MMKRVKGPRPMRRTDPGIESRGRALGAGAGAGTRRSRTAAASRTPRVMTAVAGVLLVTVMGATTASGGTAGATRSVRLFAGSAGTPFGFNSPMAIASDGSHLLVANFAGSSVTEVDAQTGALVRILAGPTYGLHDPDAVAIAAGHAWIANLADPSTGAGASVTEVNVTTGALTRVIRGARYRFDQPDGIGSDGTRVWVANGDGGTLTELSAATGKLVRIIEVAGAGVPGPSAVASAGTHVWVANGDGATTGAVTELSVKTGAIVRVVRAAKFGLKADRSLSVAANHVFVANEGGSSVTEIDARSGALVRVDRSARYEIDAPGAVTSNGSDVWVSNSGGTDWITEINARTGALVRVLTGASYGFDTSGFPDGVASDAAHVWVANAASNTVTEVVARSGALVDVLGTVSTVPPPPSGEHITTTLYAYPTQSSWTTVEHSSPEVNYSIVDICAPDGTGSGCSGAPADAPASAWVPTIAAIKQAGITPLFYVSTNGGTTSIATIESEIRDAIKWYGTPDLSLDDVAVDGTCQGVACSTYYDDLYNYAIGAGATTVTFNAGTIVPQSYVFGPDAILQVFEGSAASFRSTSFPSWMADYPPGQFSATISAGTAATVGPDLAKAEAAHIGQFYEDDESEPPSYGTLPTFWKAEVTDVG